MTSQTNNEQDAPPSVDMHRDVLSRAFGVCEEGAVVLLGDLSGIQRFIYAVAQPESAEEGIARRLRARSLQLAALSQSVCRHLVNEYELPQEYILSSSGGGFMVLAPAEVIDDDALASLRAEVDEWFWTETWGELALNLGASDAFNPAEEGALTQAVEEAFLDVADRKMRVSSHAVFANLSIDDGRYADGVFNIPYADECSSCGKLPTAAGNLCRMCEKQEQLGQNIVRHQHVRLVEEGSGHLSVFKADLELTRSVSDADIHVPNFAPSFEQLGGVPPGENGEIDGSWTADFDIHAREAIGANKIAVLAADVDNLGMVMSHEGPSFEQKLSISQELDQFFGEDLIENHVADGDRPCYLLYAGGDDVMVIGGWDRIIDLALGLQQGFSATFGRFSEEFGLKPPLTISAGVAIDGPHAPIDDTATRAHHFLEKAKTAGQPRGDRISFGGVTASWCIIRELVEFARSLHDRASLAPGNDEHVSRSFLHSLYHVMDLYDLYWKQGVPEGLRYKPLLLAAIDRNEVPEEVETKLHNLLCAKCEFTQAFRFCLDWVSLAGRDGTRSSDS